MICTDARVIRGKRLCGRGSGPKKLLYQWWCNITVNDRGIVINSSTSTSSYNSEVYGNAGAYIRGPLKVIGDITYQNSVSD